jgi:hypothetical protein
VPSHEKDPDAEDDPTLLTLSEFIREAGNRGKTLWKEDRSVGVWITDGRRGYLLPVLAGGRLPSELVESLCYRFDLPHLDFALNLRHDYDPT